MATKKSRPVAEIIKGGNIKSDSSELDQIKMLVQISTNMSNINESIDDITSDMNSVKDSIENIKVDINNKFTDPEKGVYAELQKLNSDVALATSESATMKNEMGELNSSIKNFDTSIIEINHGIKNIIDWRDSVQSVGKWVGALIISTIFGIFAKHAWDSTTPQTQVSYQPHPVATAITTSSPFPVTQSTQYGGGDSHPIISIGTAAAAIPQTSGVSGGQIPVYIVPVNPAYSSGPQYIYGIPLQQPTQLYTPGYNNSNGSAGVNAN